MNHLAIEEKFLGNNFVKIFVFVYSFFNLLFASRSFSISSFARVPPCLTFSAPLLSVATAARPAEVKPKCLRKCLRLANVLIKISEKYYLHEKEYNLLNIVARILNLEFSLTRLPAGNVQLCLP